MVLPDKYKVCQIQPSIFLSDSHEKKIPGPENVIGLFYPDLVINRCDTNHITLSCVTCLGNMGLTTYTIKEGCSERLKIVNSTPAITDGMMQLLNTINGSFNNNVPYFFLCYYQHGTWSYGRTHPQAVCLIFDRDDERT